MSENKIEIYENTLLKLLVRRGTNLDRQSVILSEGELGYTTDSQRLYIGDGFTLGGNLIGNKFRGSVNDVTGLSDIIVGDYAFDEDDLKLYVYTGTGGVADSKEKDIANWRVIGGTYAPGNNSIQISNLNKITVGQLSAGNFSTNAILDTLFIDTAGKLGLKSIPSPIQINGIGYNLPINSGPPQSFLSTDGNSNLSWRDFVSEPSLFVSSTAGQIPVGSVMPFGSDILPAGWLLCDGSSYAITTPYNSLCSAIGYTYGGTVGATFKVPNYINKTLYGTALNAAGSTIFKSFSGTAVTLSATALSAQGANYIIKYKPDYVISSEITIGGGLTASRSTSLNQKLSDYSNITELKVNLLDFHTVVGLPEITSYQLIPGGTGFNVDTYGRVTSTDTQQAGTQTEIATNTIVYNSLSPIVFLKTPIPIISFTSGTEFSCKTTLTGYPAIATFPGAAVLSAVATTPGSPSSLPSTAKNIILEARASKLGPSSGNTKTLILGAPHVNSLEAHEVTSVGQNEYVVLMPEATGGSSQVSTTSQVFLPLSAASNGYLTYALRVDFAKLAELSVVVRVVGYTN